MDYVLVEGVNLLLDCFTMALLTMCGIAHRSCTILPLIIQLTFSSRVTACMGCAGMPYSGYPGTAGPGQPSVGSKVGAKLPGSPP